MTGKAPLGDLSYSPEAWNLAQRATFSDVDSHDGRNVCAAVKVPGGGESFGYGHTTSEAMQDLARTLDRQGFGARRVVPAPGKPATVKELRARPWRAKLHYGPGSCDIHPSWSKGSLWTKPVSRRTMRKRIAEALKDPTLEKIWQVEP